MDTVKNLRPADILPQVRRAYSNLTQYEVTIRATEELPTSGRLVTKTYRLAVKWPDNVRYEMQDDDSLFGLPAATTPFKKPSIMVGADNMVWLYVPRLNMYGPVTSANNALALAVSNPSIWVKYFQSELQHILDEPAPQPTFLFVGKDDIVVGTDQIHAYLIQFDSHRKIWINTENFLIVRDVDEDVRRISKKILYFIE